MADRKQTHPAYSPRPQPPRGKGGEAFSPRREDALPRVRGSEAGQRPPVQGAAPRQGRAGGTQERRMMPGSSGHGGVGKKVAGQKPSGQKPPVKRTSQGRPGKRQAADAERENTRTFTRVSPAALSSRPFKAKGEAGRAPEFDSAPGFRKVGDAGQAAGYRAPRFQNSPREYIPESQGAPSARTLGNLREQTPSARRRRSKENRRSDLTRLRRTNYRTRFRVVKKPKHRPRYYLSRIIATLALYLLFLGVFSAFFFMSLFRHTIVSSGSVDCIVGTRGEDGYFKYESRYGSVFQNGAMYVNMTRIATLCELTTTGDFTVMRYFTRVGKGDEVLLTVGSSVAVINGTPVLLAGPTYLSGDIVYVSGDLFTRFAQGVNVEWNEEKRDLIFTREIVSTSVLGGNVYADMTFDLQEQTAEIGIAFDDLPLDLRMRIEQAYNAGGGYIAPPPSTAPLPDDAPSPDPAPMPDDTPEPNA